MKTVLIIILFGVLTLPCFAELTENGVRRIIREELAPIKIEIATIKGDIKALEGKMATKDDIRKELEPMKIEIATIKGDIKAFDGKMATKDDIIALSERMNTLYSVLISILVAIIVAILGIFLAPSLRKWFQGRKQVGEAIPRIGEKELTQIKDELKEELRAELMKELLKRNP